MEKKDKTLTPTQQSNRENDQTFTPTQQSNGKKTKKGQRK